MSIGNMVVKGLGKVTVLIIRWFLALASTAPTATLAFATTLAATLALACTAATSTTPATSSHYSTEWDRKRCCALSLCRTRARTDCVWMVRATEQTPGRSVHMNAFCATVQ